MKKLLVVLLSITFLFTLAGCGQTEQNKVEPTPVKSAEPTKNSAKSGKDNPEILIGKDKVPQEILAWAESLKEEAGLFKKNFGTWDGYVLCMGMRPTGGYAVKADDAGFSAGKEWLIQVSYVEPAPGEMVTQALTFPYEVFAIPQGVPAKFQLLQKTGDPTPIPLKDGGEQLAGKGVKLSGFTKGQELGQELVVKGQTKHKKIRVVIEDGHYAFLDKLIEVKTTGEWTEFSLKTPLEITKNISKPHNAHLVILVEEKGSWKDDLFVPVVLK